MAASASASLSPSRAAATPIAAGPRLQNKIRRRQRFQTGKLNLKISDLVTVNVALDDGLVIGSPGQVLPKPTQLSRCACKRRAMCSQEAEGGVADSPAVGIDGGQIDIIGEMHEVPNNIARRPVSDLGYAVEVEVVSASAAGHGIFAGAANENIVTSAAIQRSMPELPLRMLLAALPVITLLSVLPMPLMAAVPESVRFSTFSASTSLTELTMRSVPAPALSTT